MDAERRRSGSRLRGLFLLVGLALLVYLTLRLGVHALNVDVDLSTAALLEAATKFTSLAFFFIPGQVGAAEGTYAVACDALGLPAAAGVAFAFVRRLRTLAVAGVGLIALAPDPQRRA